MSFKPFFAELISPESVPGVGTASCLSGDGAVGYYAVFPFTSVSAPHPIQGDPKCRVMDKTYHMYTENKEKNLVILSLSMVPESLAVLSHGPWRQKGPAAVWSPLEGPLVRLNMKTPENTV